MRLISAHALTALCAATAIAAGCATPNPKRPAAAAVPPPAPPAPAVTPPPASQGVRTQSSTHAYYFGRTIDPSDEDMLWEAGTVYRREQPDRWNTNPTAPADFYAGPTVHFRSSAASPGPLPADLHQLLERQNNALRSLSLQNAALADKLAAKNTSGSSTTSSVETTATNAEGAQVGNPGEMTGDDAYNIIAPNADNVIELDPQLFTQAAGDADNPFVQIYRPQVQLRDFSLTISAAILGPKPTVVINDRIYNAGESIEGLAVHRIDDEGVWLRKGTFLFHCSVDERPLKLRIP